ncbi:MAG: hypothetical protein ACR2QF_15815 [Geminicoccaceae bacterium]
MQDRYMELGWSSHGGETTRELRSGLRGLGGRPSLHPAWSGAATTVRLDLFGATTPSSMSEFDPNSDIKAHFS